MYRNFGHGQVLNEIKYNLSIQNDTCIASLVTLITKQRACVFVYRSGKYNIMEVNIKQGKTTDKDPKLIIAVAAFVHSVKGYLF